METFGKLVRDNIPDMINDSKEKYAIDTISDDKYLEYLYIKLNEDIFNLIQNEDLEQLTDIMEVLFSICKEYGYSEESLLKKRIENKNKYGSFDKKILLKKIY